MIRMNSSVQKFETLAKDLWARMSQSSDQETPLLVGGEFKSWFVVKHLDDQHIYIQLVHNDYSEEYNGAVFKVKFQHMTAKREFLLAKLLNLYIFTDK